MSAPISPNGIRATIVTLTMNPALDITTNVDRVRPKSVRFGVAAGAAMLMTPGTAVCNRVAVERLFELVAEPTDLGAVCS